MKFYSARPAWASRCGKKRRRLYPRNPRIKPQNALGPFRDAKPMRALPVAADDLHAERKAVFAEARRQRYRWRAEQRPWRAIFRIAGVAEAFRRFAERRQGQDGVETRNVGCKACSQFLLECLGGEIVQGGVTP